MRAMKRARLSLGAAALTLACGAIAPGAAVAQVFGGNELVDWSVSGAPAAGVDSITFPMTMNPPTARVAGVFAAVQFGFANQSDVGYTGLQPRPSVNGKPRLRGVFSSFIPGSITNDPQCRPGADGGPGVSCGVDFDAVYGHTYDLVVERVGLDTWRGSARDTATGQQIRLGIYTLPVASGSLRASQVAFVEYYDVPGCDALPKYDVTFGAPRSGKLVGAMTWTHEYGECLGKGMLTVGERAGSVRLTRGLELAEHNPPTVLTPPNGAVTSSTPEFTGIGDPGAIVSMMEAGGVPLCLAHANAWGEWGCVSRPMADGRHRIVVTHGNAGTISTVFLTVIVRGQGRDGPAP